jgi:hypothetical protein
MAGKVDIQATAAGTAVAARQALEVDGGKGGKGEGEEAAPAAAGAAEAQPVPFAKLFWWAPLPAPLARLGLARRPRPSSMAPARTPAPLPPRP